LCAGSEAGTMSRGAIASTTSEAGSRTLSFLESGGRIKKLVIRDRVLFTSLE